MVDTRKSEHASASCSPTGEPSQQQIIRKEPERRLPPPPPPPTYQNGWTGRTDLENPRVASVSPRRDESLRWSCRFILVQKRL